MPARARREPAAKAPEDLNQKRPALSALSAVEAEVAAEENGDGSVVVTLRTELGFADIRVPPMGRWRALARNAIFTRGDSLLWAAKTLSPTDAQQWVRLDPSGEEVDEFFEDFGRASEQALGDR